MNRCVIRAAVAAVSLAGLAGQVLATTQSSLTLSGFSYALKDLNTGDGVAPALTWLGGATLSGSASDYVQTGWGSSDSWMFTQWSPAGSADGWSDSTLNVGSGLSQVSGVLSGGLPDHVVLDNSVAAGQRSYSYAFYNQSFTLSADSQVTFRVVLDGQLSGTSASNLWTPPVGATADAHSSADFGGGMWVVNTASNYFSSSAYNNWVWYTAAYESIVDGQPLQLTLRNNSAVDMTYSLQLNMSAGASESLAPVPEPASYALMVLGLVAIGAVAKKRRRG